MDKKKYIRAFHIGGSLETALNGNYRLSATEVIREAAAITNRHFWLFCPAIFAYLTVSLLVFLLAFTLLIDPASNSMQQLIADKVVTSEMRAVMAVSAAISVVISAPLYASACLMGLSHSLGLMSRLKDMLSRNYAWFTIAITMGVMQLVEYAAAQLLPFAGTVLSALFSMSVLLICEKQLTPFSAILISCRAISKKFVPIAVIYLLLLALFFIGYLTAGLALIWILPFMFNLKGVLYREMFGVGIEIVQAPQ
ncbi:MAG: hypothetical protein ACRC9T_02315, partial [Vibrionaceae bacterium]